MQKAVKAVNAFLKVDEECSGIFDDWFRSMFL